jgi:hypothetical protein
MPSILHQVSKTVGIQVNTKTQKVQTQSMASLRSNKSSATEGI